jgi:hypothetical protein
MMSDQNRHRTGLKRRHMIIDEVRYDQGLGSVADLDSRTIADLPLYRLVACACGDTWL